VSMHILGSRVVSCQWSYYYLCILIRTADPGVYTVVHNWELCDSVRAMAIHTYIRWSTVSYIATIMLAQGWDTHRFRACTPHHHHHRHHSLLRQDPAAYSTLLFEVLSLNHIMPGERSASLCYSTHSLTH